MKVAGLKNSVALSRAGNRQWVLKPQDLGVALRLVTLKGEWLPYAALGEAMRLSRFEAHAAVQRLTAAGLVAEIEGPPRAVIAALRAFVIFGARYAYPPVRGGITIGFPTAPRAELIRATQDVDVVAQAAIEARGFAHDRSPEAPVCRWMRGGLKVDLMPTEPLLGFHNRWYRLAVDSAVSVTIPIGARIRLIAAPVFLGTKLEAFQGRGAGNYLASHDLEDILTVVDGREELIAEARVASPELRTYLAERFSALLAVPDFIQAIPGHLPGDQASQARAPMLLRRLRSLATLSA